MHREGSGSMFCAKYGIHRLVYFEYHRYVRNAIGRENALKRFSRAEKVALIGRVNPTWEDLLPEGVQVGLMGGGGVEQKADSPFGE